MKRPRTQTALVCAILLALPCVAAKPKKYDFKPVRPGGIPDAPASVPRAEPADIPIGPVSKIAPTTRAKAVMVIDARTGEIFHEKNADIARPPASTQKLLTAMIVAERGFLDRPVVVLPVDTMAEPVKLNIKAATRINDRFAAALLVKIQ